jgi:hypothetical protein
MKRLNVPLFAILFVSLGLSCVSTAQGERKQAENLCSQLHEGMTFEQVSKIIPLTQRNESGLYEHGGVWYDVPVSGHYYLQLRFEHSKDRGVADLQSHLNLPPRVRRPNGRVVLRS